ncbi:LysR family transcriptional regulator [Roseinatronobacter bogoriensis]|uniref:LysR family transcriptional regulator n=1 Tax=Roseinatronobacter bogoriensis subsp. barguzinensis TaxID=441209 RepID=A0A2K8KEX6_9RHOB|nr:MULTISPECIES: LysR family transcriptional regulator [Rhodobaca]ATX67546.1 LysR family transcriptional regulator [Rhodobaca barguzinensis]MBB4209700.1 DNA-binding transcriptional LysR family regulator [Rhodobaca bogoriensis DSM 18756]TDW33875.1 DNA-binding transcriptional LysR family regulator [Rhodobaca barguzinensis]TDY66275.1 DNA-binding transcriptional LysR family regulator [Rhodobaca bogoriensis DSM 18756]
MRIIFGKVIRMDIRNLETLLAVVRHGSFSDAGKSLGLSRSGVSIRIAALEEEFGQPLFDRSTRPPRLTREGQFVLDQAREMLAVWGRMKRHEKSPEESGLFKLGAVQTVTSGILPFALKRFRDAFPRVRVTIRTGLADELDAMVRVGELDAAVQPLSGNIHAGLTWQTICVEPLMVVAPAGLSGKRDVDLLNGLPFIRYRRIAWGLGRTIQRELAERGIEVSILAEVDSFDAAMNLVRNGLGVTVLPLRRMPDPFPDGVRHIAFGNPPLVRTLGVLWRENVAPSGFVRGLCAALEDSAAEFCPEADTA